MHISLPVIITTTDVRIRRQHKHKLRTLPATCTSFQQSFYVRCIPLWNALIKEAATASTAEVFQRAAIPVIDIIVDCFSVNHALPAFLFNVLIMLLIYYNIFINLFIILALSDVSFTLHDREI